MSIEYLKEHSKFKSEADNIARSKALEAMRDAKEFSASDSNGLESSMCGGGSCGGAPCNPGPGGPPPKCQPIPQPPRPPRES